MKRYLVFNYGPYYPGGGLHDLVLATDDLSAVQSVIEEYLSGVIWDDHLHVLDCLTGQVVVSLWRRDCWPHGNGVKIEYDVDGLAADFRERQK